MQQTAPEASTWRGPAIGLRAVLGFGLALAVLTVHAVLALVNVQTVADNERRVRQSYEVLDAVRTTLSALQDAETGERGYIITGDERYLVPYHQGLARYEQQLGRIKILAKGSPELHGFAGQLDAMARDKLQSVDLAIQMRRDHGFEAGQAAVAASDSRLIMADIRDLVAQMLRKEQGLLRDYNQHSEMAVDMATSASLVMALLGAGIIGIAYGLVRREIVQRRESQRFLRSVLDSLTSQIAVLDRDGVILEVNDAWRRFGQENDGPAESVGQNYLTVCQSEARPSEDSQHVVTGIRQVIAGKRPFFLMQYPCHAVDRPRWFVVRVTRFPHPGPIRVVVAHDDVTHRVLAEQAIAQRSQQLQRLAEFSMRLGEAEQVQDIVTLIAHESRLLIGAHQALASAVGDPPSSGCIEKVSLSEKHPDDSETSFQWRDPDVERAVCRLNAPLRMTQAELEAHSAFANLLAKPRQPAFRGWLSAPLVGRDGRNLGLIQLSDKQEGEFTAEDEAILMQLARLSASAIENTRLYEALQETNRRKDEFLAMLGHELRNPLAGIVTSAQVLPLLAAGDPDRPKMQAVIERQAGHMVRMVDDLLDVSRIARGKLTLERQRVDLVQLVEQAVDDFQHGHPGDRLVAETDMPGEPVWILGDGTRLQQVVTNLIHNACKFSENPCRVRLRLFKDAARNLAVLSLRDCGIGMTPETLARIFEPFNQAESTIDRSRGGMGLGLALVNGLVQLHRGRITATSEGLGHGAEFVIELPLALTVPPERNNIRPAQSEVQCHRILLIDDTKDVLFPLERMLSVRGLEVASAYDGPSGLELARQFRPDLILCDIGLPDGMDGYAVAGAMRADPLLHNVYLVAVTGYGQEEDRRLARDAGFDFHMTKPLSKANLDLLLTECPRFEDLVAQE